MEGFWLVAFAVAAGFTASGIAANLYRLVCEQARIKPDTRAGRTSRWLVMVIAGPNVLFATALRNMRARAWKPLQFWLVTALVGYWSLALGLFVIDLAIHM
ncbi:MAG: DUF6949 family protein [Alphaproteobacteria bacterium]